MQRKTYEAGELIFREGQASDAAYLIVSGQVEIVIGLDEGRPKIVGLLGKGEIFGEMGAIDNQPRSATARAKGPLVCMWVDQDSFMNTLLNRPQESIELLKALFERLRVANQKIMSMEAGEDRQSRRLNSG